MNYLIDANVLLRLSDDDDPRHETCSQAITVLLARGEQLFVCAQVLAEFWVALTRPTDVNGWGWSFEDAQQELADTRQTFRCLAEPPDMADRWQKVVTENRVLGKQAHDARIAALMLAHGVKHIITLNPSDFSRYTGIEPVEPTEVAQR